MYSPLASLIKTKLVVVIIELVSLISKKPVATATQCRLEVLWGVILTSWQREMIMNLSGTLLDFSGGNILCLSACDKRPHQC